MRRRHVGASRYLEALRTPRKAVAVAVIVLLMALAFYLFIVHDLAVVRHLSEWVAVIYLGRIVEMGTAEQVYGSPQHPYTAAVLSLTHEPDVKVRGRERVVLTGDLPSAPHPPTGRAFRTRRPIGPLSHPKREVCLTTSPSLAATIGGQVAACHFPGELSGIGDVRSVVR